MTARPTTQKASHGLVSRAFVTIAATAALMFGAEHLLLPGVSEEFADAFGGPWPGLSIFALGITPIVPAYLLVELVAFCVPRWSLLRHDNPEGRSRLEAIARVVAVVLALMQAYPLALFLRGVGNEPGVGEQAFSTSVPVVVVCLATGVCIQLLVAELISRRGLLNGLVVLASAELLRVLFESARKILKLDSSPGDPQRLSTPVPHDLDIRGLVFSALAIIVSVLATWLALRARERPVDDAGAKARALAADSWVPAPSGSFQPYLMATWLVAFPATLARRELFLRPLAELMKSERVLVLTLIAVSIVATWILSRLMHRPAELARLVARVGAGADAGSRRAMLDALRAALWPTLALLGTVILADRVSLIAIAGVVSLVPVVMDLAHSVRVYLKDPDLVPIWDERRIAAVPLLRAVLADAGIATEVRGWYVLSFWQLFVPYAPVQLLVSRSEEERARAALRDLALAEQNALPVEPASDQRAHQVSAHGRRARLLAGCLAAAAGLYALSHAPALEANAAGSGVHPIDVQAVRIDDTIDPFANASNSTVAPESGIVIAREQTRAGAQHMVETSYARITIGEHETKDVALQRLRAGLEPFALPPDARFGFGDIVEDEQPARGPAPSGVRSYVLVGEAAFHRSDVVSAVVMDSSYRTQPDVILRIGLSPPATKRFAEMTGEWTDRRIAIILDDEIVSAPLVISAIAGGQLTLLTRKGDLASKLAQAKRWQQGLLAR